MYTTGDEKCLARGYLTLLFKVNHQSQLTDFIFSEILDIENARIDTKINIISCIQPKIREVMQKLAFDLDIQNQPSKSVN